MDAAELALSGRRIDEFEVTVVPVVFPAEQNARVPVFVEISTDQLDIGTKGRKKVRLDVHGYALDESGEVQAGFARELRFRLRDERVVALADEISLPSGTHELRLLAWDLRGQRRHLSNTPIEVRLDSMTRPRLSGPFFLASGTDRRQFTRGAVDPLDALALFELDDDPKAIDAAPAIGLDRSRRFLVLAPDWQESEPTELRLRLLAADGAAIDREIEFERLDDGADGTARFAGLVDTSGLAAGRYRLEASLEGHPRGPSVSAADFDLIEPGESQSR